jgi:hypothetical protein
LTCECERTAEPSITQALHLANGDTVNAKLRDPKSRAAKKLASKEAIDAWLEEAYLATVCRKPTPSEIAVVREAIAEVKDDTRSVLEDTLWALLSSREFLFNH